MATIADIKMKGLVPLPKSATLNVRSKPSTSFPSLALIKQTDGELIGITTGQGLTEANSSNTWWYVTLSPEFIAKHLPGQTYGWVRSDVTNFITLDEWNKTFATGQPGQKIVDALIANDKEVYKNLFQCSLYLNALRAKNIDVSKYQSTYDVLMARFNDRQTALKNNTALKVQTGLYTVAANLNTAIQKGEVQTMYGGMMGIGAIPVLAIVIGAIVGITATIIVYYTFRPKYEESKANLVVSKDLATALSKVNPETAASIKADLEKQIDTAYNAGKNAGFWKGLWDIGKYPIIFLGGFLVVDKFVIPFIQKRKK